MPINTLFHTLFKIEVVTSEKRMEATKSRNDQYLVLALSLHCEYKLDSIHNQLLNTVCAPKRCTKVDAKYLNPYHLFFPQ